MNIDVQQIKQRFGIIGHSELFDRAIRIAVQVATTDMSVLVTGESGVGKEFFPQIIHRYSSRKHNAYIAVNCGAIPEGTIDSELFGHRKGSFTGALADRKGYFEEADSGTIFLDEVGELPPATQARLLRVLESGEYIPVGASVAQKTDVRVVAATNVNLSEAVARGRFREDLLFRLNTVPIAVPSLRGRVEDAPLLFRKFASDSAERYHMPALRLTPEAEEVLKAYSWPGNIRELRNLTDRLSVLESERDVSAGTLRSYLPDNAFSDRHPVLFDKQKPADGSSKMFNNERELLYQVLFDMRKDITDLKELVHDIMQGSISVAHEDPRRDTPSIDTPSDIVAEAPSSTVPVLIKHTDSLFLPQHQTSLRTSGEVNDIEIVHENNMQSPFASLRIADAELSLIRQAIGKYGIKNKKEVADALGISERTLYRKIKEYGLE